MIASARKYPMQKGLGGQDIAVKRGRIMMISLWNKPIKIKVIIRKLIETRSVKVAIHHGKALTTSWQTPISKKTSSEIYTQ